MRFFTLFETDCSGESQMPTHHSFKRKQRKTTQLKLNLSVLLLSLVTGLSQPVAAADVTVDLTQTMESRPFPHFWENMFGSGRAALALRAAYQEDISTVKAQLPFQYVRFHGIFHDELGVVEIDKKTHKPVYNFTYIDQIYDDLLQHHVKPFVELGFMPLPLATHPEKRFGFWYKPNVNPPKSYAAWDDLISHFTHHLLERYGAEELESWYFEVWNEPNIGFWGGIPAQKSYFELYDHTAKTIKAINPKLRVGGPSTAQAAWAYDFLKHAADQQIPVDFVSSHVYANDTSKDVFHNNIPIARDEMVCRSVRKVHDEIVRSPLPQIPLIFSEYNASYANEPNVTDSIYMGPWLATTIAQCDGLTQMMSLWTFSDVFEEQGVPKTPFYGGFGLIATGHIAKPALNALAILHRLGDQRLNSTARNSLVTQRSDGTWVVALWNYAAPDGTGDKYTPPPLETTDSLRFQLILPANIQQATVYRVDRHHGNVMDQYDAMGRPLTPTREQVVSLRAAAQLPAPEHMTVGTAVEVLVPRQGLAVIELH
jgi:xylan 1,4-beta-xylosidase